ncbi:MAG: alpha-amylase family glycosyl hydrolase [Firmicutes bacterium]|nr:alpha-amylase family glycosyl hydrolase [Bacillota bacterium]
MKFSKKFRSALLIALSILMVLTSCGKKDIAKEKKSNIPDEAIVEYDDKYKNFYEIFVRSFSDSDGNRIGDLNGVISKLDYLKAALGADDSKSLGINGIWLMPICPSPSYHKYDIKDYCAIDPSYGTMEDFENLIKACHDRNITVIIDMVFNHTSKEHEWFIKFCENLRAETDGKELPHDAKYSEYYTVVTEDEKIDGVRYKPITCTDYFYECNFSDDMPELNYDSEYVWEEIFKICDFWIDKGVDGFRFDAVLYFYYLNTSENVKVLNRITEYCKSKNPNFYTVGEAWTSSLVISKYYQSGMDSFFNFPYANTGGYLPTAVKNLQGAELANRIQTWNNTLELVSATDAIDAPFISNHDMYRSSSYFQTLSQRKMAASLYQMMPGNTFIYYGEEIGLKGTSTDSSKKDPTARMPMKWSESESGIRITYAPGTDPNVNQDDVVPAFDQWDDENSLLNHYRMLLKLKNQNPQIARGVVTACDFKDSAICAYTCVYDGVAVMVIHNLSLDEKTFNLKDLGYSDFSEFRGYVVSKGLPDEVETASAPVLGQSSEAEETTEEKEAIASLDNGTLVIPGRTTVVLRSTEHYDDVVINADSITTSSEDETVQANE